jgi:hypothetical protein
MGRFPIAAVFILASMLAVSAAHAGRIIDEGRGLQYGAGSTPVGSDARKWPYAVEALELIHVKEAAGSPAAPAPARAEEPEQGFAFVHRKIWGHDINCYKKVPVTGF